MLDLVFSKVGSWGFQICSDKINWLRCRHVRGSQKWIPGSDPKDLDPGSVRIIDPTLTVCDRSTGIIDPPSQ